MSNVRIEAVGACGLIAEVVLGANTRATHAINAGESVVLTVGGGQRLNVLEAPDEAAPTAEAEGTLEVGADVSTDGTADVTEEVISGADVGGFPVADISEMFGQPD